VCCYITTLNAEIFDKHYDSLCQSLSQDVEHTIARVLQLQILFDEEMEAIYSSDNKTEAIVDVLIAKFALKNDMILFCGVFDMLHQNQVHTHIIELLRNGK